MSVVYKIQKMCFRPFRQHSYFQFQMFYARTCSRCSRIFSVKWSEQTLCVPQWPHDFSFDLMLLIYVSIPRFSSFRRKSAVNPNILPHSNADLRSTVLPKVLANKAPTSAYFPIVTRLRVERTCRKRGHISLANGRKPGSVRCSKARLQRRCPLERAKASKVDTDLGKHNRSSLNTAPLYFSALAMTCIS